MSDARRLWLMVIFALWALAWGGSFAAYVGTPAEGEGFVRGMNRVVVFLGWQGIASVLAIAVWGLGRGWPKGAPVRRLARVPVGLAGLLAAALVALFAWARLQG